MSRTLRLFWTVLALSLILKLGLAAWLPLTGDEAYFYLWGKYPDFGYYDHPPMVGWFLHLLLYFGDAEWWLRLPAVLLSSFIGWGIYRMLRHPVGEERAVLVALLYLLSPMSLTMVLIATDTPLILFSFLSAWALWRALDSQGYRWFVVSGLLLGLAFLSKFFAVLLGLAYGVYLLLVRRSRRNAVGLLLLFLAVLPFAALTLWWNYNHCWDNILFNLINRHSGSDAGSGEPLYFVGMLLYLVTPPLLWYGWRHRREGWRQLRGGTLFAWLWLLPMLLFALLSFGTTIGLHWVLAFYPFLFLSLPLLFGVRELRRSAIFMAGFSFLHLLMLAALMLMPLDTWKENTLLHHDLVYGMHLDEFWHEIEPLAGERRLATGNYAYSAMLEYETGRRVAVFGDASKHGRQDDILTDYRELDGKGLAILLYADRHVARYKSYFDRAELHTLTVRGARHFLLVGDGFDYSRYRDDILELVRKKYYRMPWFLPAGSCYFYDRYYPQQDIERLPRK